MRPPTPENDQTPRALAPARVVRVEGAQGDDQADLLAVEEPLEIRIGHEVEGRRVVRGLSVTMRTPGQDEELAAGFLFTEGVVDSPGQVAGVRPCGPSGNVVRVDLAPGVAVDLARLERHSYTTSSCGVCGKTSLEAVRVAARSRPVEGRPAVEPAVLHRLPGLLRAAQAVFERTGGLHASALFDVEGRLLRLREDVGRHNALDKLIGGLFLEGRTPIAEGLVLLSGRVSFELVQKAAVAGVPILAAVGAPSSLAVDLAREAGLTVIGFLRGGRFNIYSGADRVRLVAPTTLSSPSPARPPGPLAHLKGLDDVHRAPTPEDAPAPGPAL